MTNLNYIQEELKNRFNSTSGYGQAKENEMYEYVRTKHARVEKMNAEFSHEPEGKTSL